MKPLLSPKDLAEAIGVSESSIKRWVDNGEIQATKTAGGHRRIPINEAVRFLRETQAALVNPEAIGLKDVDSLLDLEASRGGEGSRFYDYLREGQADSARGLILSMYLNGRTVAQIVDGPISSALERLGELWREEECGIFWEHRATEIAISAVQLSPSKSSGSVVTVCTFSRPPVAASWRSTVTVESSSLIEYRYRPDGPKITWRGPEPGARATDGGSLGARFSLQETQ